MKTQVILRSLLNLNVVILLFGIVSLSWGCGQQASVSQSDSPTGAYTRLYDAVKRKDVEAIKAIMSKKSLEFAKMAASQQNKPIEKILENGFTATTFSETMPEIRDERASGDMGAVEVYNSKDKVWEDLPFIREDGSWKLAIGDIFANTWKSPGPGRAQKEREATNAVSNNLVPLDANINGNMNSVQVIKPKPAGNVK